MMMFSGLEAQLLGIVVRKERPELEEQKDRLVVDIAKNKKKLQDLEDEILRWVGCLECCMGIVMVDIPWWWFLVQSTLIITDPK